MTDNRSFSIQKAKGYAFSKVFNAIKVVFLMSHHNQMIKKLE